MPATPIDRRSAEPKHRQIAHDLRVRITAGEWVADALLPAEHDLAHQYEVGRDAVRKAIYALRDEGTLVRSAGERWRVGQVPALVPNGKRGGRERIVLPRGSVLSARMPSVEERAAGWPADVPVVEVRYDGQTRAFRADEHDFRPY